MNWYEFPSAAAQPRNDGFDSQKSAAAPRMCKYDYAYCRRKSSD